jgi:methylated-DNA-[protein]-cysteine S-methyltransferase
MESILHTTYMQSPLGTLRISGSEQGISEIAFCEEASNEPAQGAIPACLQTCVQQLQEYFAGGRHTFDVVLAPKGTTFQQQVWQQLLAIPHGKTSTYLAVARAVSTEKAIRAVGTANGRNPICIVVPCHRVIGSDGSLTGYAGGLWRKDWLLRHEGALGTSQQYQLF